MPPLETRTDSPGETPDYPKIHVGTGEESSGSSTVSTQGNMPRHRRVRNPGSPPSNSHGDWPFLRPPQRVTEVPVVSRGHLPQLEKIQEVLPFSEMGPISAEASPGKSHLTSGTSKGSFTPLLHLKKFPDIPVSTREEARESRPHPEEPRFRLLDREETSFRCVFGKEFPAYPSHVKRRCFPQKRREELQGHATTPRDIRCLRPFQGNLFSLHCIDFQAKDRLTPRWHVGQPCGKAS